MLGPSCGIAVTTGPVVRDGASGDGGPYPLGLVVVAAGVAENPA
ncbi:hypothetical protein ACWGJB_38990 [Streptomyces sp. NPDC054813]